MTAPKALTGLKVFAVEDESLVAMQLEDMLYDFGCEVVGVAMRFNRALEMAAALPQIDFAVLDVNIGGDKVYPVAERLRARGVPIVFATGYGRTGVDAEWHGCQIVQKPYTAKELGRHIVAAVSATR
ncbi:response regulator [Aureimonas leprariae]|uniref:Response regulator n=1 Tax=Plantimonas leprariae TaxID=2615207 RepID=A0A7V7PR55_9HYPH|nr:response regulator [Aureimonas leprariae]